jgi:hypothetical protein
MKKIYLFGLVALGMLALSSCNDGKDELTDSRLTYYADLTMEGDEFMIVPVGTAYVEPGCKGVLYDKVTGEFKDISSQISIGGDKVDPNTMGFYYITYSAAGSDGFLSTVTRTVCVCDPTVTLDISGSYNTDMNASLYGANQNPFAAYAANYGYTTQCTGITFTRLAPGFFQVSDLLGGWYDQIRGFGVQYTGGIGMMTGYVSADNEGNIDLISSYIGAWGDALDYIEDGKYDAETGTISYFASYAEGAVVMSIVLHKQ